MNTLYILILSSLGYLATDIYLPSMPSISEFYNTTEGAVQNTVSAYLFSFAIAPLFFGPLSDHIGRKKVILLGLTISVTATFCCYLPVNIYWLIFARFIQGIGMGAVVIAARAMMTDLYKGKELAKQISYITMLMPLILAIAPMVGGHLQEFFDWQAVFLFLLSYIIIILLAMPYLKESVAPVYNDTNNKKNTNILIGYKYTFTNYNFLLKGLGMVIPSVGIFSYITASPFLFQEIIGLSPAKYGQLSLYIGAVIFICSYLNTRLLKFISVNMMICIGSVIMLLAGILLISMHFLEITTTYALLIPSLLFFTCIPFCMSNSASNALGSIKKHFGVASAILTTTQLIFGTIGSLIFSAIRETDFLPLAICFTSCGLLMVITSSVIKNKN